MVIISPTAKDAATTDLFLLGRPGNWIK